MADPNNTEKDDLKTMGAEGQAEVPSLSNGGSNEPAQQPKPIFPGGVSTTTANESKPEPKKLPDEFKGSSNGELIDFLERKVSEHKRLSDEDLKKIRRRQKAEGIISGISDAVRAVANMGFTSYYAPNMYDSEKSMSKRAKERFEKEKAERQAEEDKYYNYAMLKAKLMDADRDQQLKMWQLEHSLEREGVNDHWRELIEERRQNKELFDAEKRELELKYLAGKIDRDKYLTEQERLETEYMNKHNSKMPVTPKPSTGGSGGRGGHGGSTGGQSWTIVNDETGEEKSITAKSIGHAHNQVPDGWHLKNGIVVSESNSESNDGIATKTTKRTSTRSYQTGGGSASGQKKQPAEKTKKKKTNVKWK